MKSAAGLGLATAFTVALALGSACDNASTASGGASPVVSGAPAPSEGAGQLDPAVNLPSGFPADVPVYTGARLTQQRSTTSNGATAWSMLWETLDSVERVQVFYTAQLDQGDWTLSYSGSASGTFSAYFKRKSESKIQGILAVDGSSGVTKITMALAKQ